MGGERLSSKKTKTNFRKTGRNKSFMAAWNVDGALGKKLSERLGLDVLASAKRVEGSFKVPRPKVSSMMASLASAKRVEGSFKVPRPKKVPVIQVKQIAYDSDSQTTEERSARYASTSHAERDTPSRSSRRGDHRRSRRDSPEYDRRVSPEYDRRQAKGYAASPWDNVAPSPVPIRASGSVRSASSRTVERDEEANNEKFINLETIESMRLEMEYDADRAWHVSRKGPSLKKINYLLLVLSPWRMITRSCEARVAAPRGRGRGNSKRGKKTDTSSSSINRMMMSNDDDDDDDDDVPKRMNKSQPRIQRDSHEIQHKSFQISERSLEIQWKSHVI
ncbi:hypothetical protein Tco_1218481 [Tanacetum coccineum]